MQLKPNGVCWQIISDDKIIQNNSESAVNEPYDPVTLTYLNPDYIIKFYEKIKDFRTPDTIFISLAQGALRAGFAISNAWEVEHLPIRLSMHKSKDKAPQIDPEEFLEKVQNKQIFVFDITGRQIIANHT